MTDAEMQRALKYRVDEHYREDGVMHVQVLTVHPGPRAWKTVSLLTFGDLETGDVRGRELRAQTWAAKPPSDGAGYDFEQTDYHWHCEGDDEIEAIRLFLSSEFSEAGRYRLLREGSELATFLAEAAEEGGLASRDAVSLLELASDRPEVASALAASPRGLLVAEAVELERRRQQLDELKRIVEDPESSERDDIQPQLKQMGWIFGGRYVGESRRRQLSTGDVLDIPLLRPDGSLHVVELKGASIPRLVEQHRGTANPQMVAGEPEEVPLIVGHEAHKAVGQVMNYLVHLDEVRDHILTRFKIDTRRASATVLIGHPDFVTDFPRRRVDETIRIYNSHLARVELKHYAELIESAERSLALAAEPEDDDEAPEFGQLSGDGGDSDPWGPAADRVWSDEPPF